MSKNNDREKDSQEDDWRYGGPMLATDGIIEYDFDKGLGVVLIERKYFPKKIALPGGMAEYGISLPDNVRKESKEETGLEVIITDDDKPFMINSLPGRDPRGHIVSVTYIVKGYGTIKPDEKEDASRAWPCSIDDLKKMFNKDLFAFDHEHILKEYLIHKGYMKR